MPIDHTENSFPLQSDLRVYALDKAVEQLQQNFLCLYLPLLSKDNLKNLYLKISKISINITS